ncbi:hypothetical protein [Vibrio phage BONAISHI]|nr:hypothetical protein [Vibrio phage BONAISHI]
MAINDYANLTALKAANLQPDDKAYDEETGLSYIITTMLSVQGKAEKLDNGNYAVLSPKVSDEKQKELFADTGDSLVVEEWNAANAYKKDEAVTRNNYMYLANSNIAANTAFVQGTGNNQWRRVDGVVPNNEEYQNIKYIAFDMISCYGINYSAINQIMFYTRNGDRVIIPSKAYSRNSSNAFVTDPTSSDTWAGDECLDENPHETQSTPMEYCFMSRANQVPARWVFALDTPISFTTMKLVNFAYHNGTGLDRGVKDCEVRVSAVPFDVDNVQGNDAGSVLLFQGTLPMHPSFSSGWPDVRAVINLDVL